MRVSTPFSTMQQRGSISFVPGSLMDWDIRSTSACSWLKLASPLAVYLDEEIDSSALAPRASSLDGKIVGLLPNWRPAAGSILQALSSLLAQRYRLKDVVMEAPARHGVMPTPQQLDALARRVDVMLVASGD